MFFIAAKNYKGHHRNTALSSHEHNVARSNGGGECSGSSPRSISSRENSETQGEVRIHAHVGILRNPEQNGTSISSDSTAMSKESNFVKNKENGKINSRSDERYSNYEQKGSANSAQHTVLTEETSFLRGKENGETDEVDDLSVLKTQAVDYPTVSESEQCTQHTVENSTKEDDNGRDELCNSIAVENHHQKQIGNVNCDSETSKVEDSQPLENEELQLLPTEEKSTEDEDDQHELKLRRHVNSENNASSSSASPAIEIPEEDLSSQQEVPEETREMHLVRGDSNQDQHEQTQLKYVYSARDASSCTESPGMEKPTRFTSENPVDGDSSDQLSNETGNFDLIEKHSHLVCKEYEQGNHPIEVVGYAKSAKEASSSFDTLDIKKSMLLASENPAEHDVFYPEVSKVTTGRKLKEERLRRVSENELHHHDADKFKSEESNKEKRNQNDQNKSVDSIDDQIECVMLSSAVSLSTEETQGVYVDSVYETEDGLEACGRDCVSKPSSSTNLKTSDEMGTTKFSEDSHCESISLEGVKEISTQNNVNLRDSAVLIESEVGSLLKENPESLSKRSPGYDGSVSSCDGNDDKIPKQPQLIGEETLSTINAVACYKSAEESPEWNGTPLERRINKNLKVQPQDRNSSSMLIDEKLKSRMIEEEGLLEGNGISQRNNRYRVNRDSFLPRVPYRRRSSEMTHETESCSSYTLHDKRSSFHMHRHPQWEGKEFRPTYYNSETSGEIYDRPKYHAFNDRRRVESYSQSGNLPQRPYSGELFSQRYSYMHRDPEDRRRWSSQLPPPAVYYRPGVHTGPSWETRWDPYDSYPTSPPRFVESESSYAWGHDSLYLSDDQRHKDQIMRRLYLKEKRLAVRKQFHPIAGGAPFITCYFCFNILELPTDFLLSRRSRKTHKLKCGACSRVLEFSLENEGCLAPSETSIERNDNLVVTSRTIHSWQSSLNSAGSRELLSQESFSTSGREKRKIVPESSRTREQSEELHNTEPTARGRPPKVTWQRSTRSKTPLHRLMGYSLPKDLLTEHEADDVE